MEGAEVEMQSKLQFTAICGAPAATTPIPSSRRIVDPTTNPRHPKTPRIMSSALGSTTIANYSLSVIVILNIYLGIAAPVFLVHLVSDSL